MIKKILPNACKSPEILAYLSFKCGVVVELVTTLACHAGGRGFKSPPSRHFVLPFLLFFSCNYQILSYCAESTSVEKIKIVAVEDPVNSFVTHLGDKKHSNNKKEINYLGTDFEIITMILDELKINYEINTVPLEHNMNLMLESGEADFAVGVKKTKDTLLYANFLKTPIRTQKYYFYGRKNEANSTKMTFQDVLMHNYNVGIKVGASYPEIFWQAFPFENNILNSHLTESRTYGQNVIKLKNKKIDLFVANKDIANLLLIKLKENSIYQYKNILYWKEFNCAFSAKSKYKNIDDLKNKIQRMLYVMDSNKELEEINNYWIEKAYEN